jgi:hypothetical protein
MPDYSLVPVDYRLDFDGISLFPVDHDPFVVDGTSRQAQVRQTQVQPEIQPEPAVQVADAANDNRAPQAICYQAGFAIRPWRCATRTEE